MARKLEKMVARKHTVRLQSLGHGVPPREARPGEPGSPGDASWRGAGRRARDSGPEGDAAGPGSAPRGDRWAPPSGRVHGSGCPGWA